MQTAVDPVISGGGAPVEVKHPGFKGPEMRLDWYPADESCKAVFTILNYAKFATCRERLISPFVRTNLLIVDLLINLVYLAAHASGLVAIVDINKVYFC